MLWLLAIPVVGGLGTLAYTAYQNKQKAKVHVVAAPGVSAITSAPVPTPNGGTTFAVAVPSTGYQQVFVTQPVAPGVIAIPTTNLTTGTTFDQVNLAPGHIGDIMGATSGPNGTDFLLMVPGNKGGGIAAVHSSNETVLPSVAPIAKAAQAQALDIGNPLIPGTTQLQVAWVDGAGTAQTTTFSITAV